MLMSGPWIYRRVQAGPIVSSGLHKPARGLKKAGRWFCGGGNGGKHGTKKKMDSLADHAQVQLGQPNLKYR
jgi:hypothetical protein